MTDGPSERPEVAWKAIEEGADAIAADGSKAGSVSRVVGDTDADIFTGLTIRRQSLGAEHLVESVHVARIWPDRVVLHRTPDALERLPKYEDEPVMHVRPRGGGLFSRLFRPRR